MGQLFEANVEWQAVDGESFTTGRFSRRHDWRFDGGAVVAASASPQVVPEPMSDPAAVDPEEALVAALASCHMMSFLHLAARQRLTVLSYRDAATGEMGQIDGGRTAMLRATLHPRIEFAGDADPAQVDALHRAAHDLCYIANSVNFPVVVEPVR